MSYKFIVPVSQILISDSLPQTKALRHVQAILPQLQGFDPSRIHTFKAADSFTHEGTTNWDALNRDKSFLIFDNKDLLAPNYIHDSVIEFLRPVFIMEIDDIADTSHVTLFHRRLIYTGKQGHAHATYHPSDPTKNKRFSTINLVPGTLETMSPEEAKSQYDTY